MSLPQVLLGSTRSRDLLQRMQSLGWGRLFAAERPKPAALEAWALDNGVFGAWKGGHAWNEQAFLWCLHAAERGTWTRRFQPPMFAVLPDIVADAGSLHHSMDWWARKGRLYDVPWFLVVQNGMTVEDVRHALRSAPIAGLFLGGDDDFKRTAPMWCELAHSEERRFHYARVSTAERLREACAIGTDSCDTTQPLWSAEGFARFERAWLELREAA